MKELKTKHRPFYDPETRAAAVALYRAGQRQEDIAHKFGCCARQVRRWVRQTDIDENLRPGMTSGQRRELMLLRRANARLQERVLLMEEAMDFFAKETR